MNFQNTSRLFGRSFFTLLFLFLIFLVAPGCGDDDDDDNSENPNGDATDDDSTDDDDDDSSLTRPFYMAAAPFEFNVSEFSIQSDFNFAGFDGRLDMISLHMDNFFGLPWDEFAAGGQNLPAAWLQKMETIRNAVQKLNLPVYLSLTPLSGIRDSIAAKAQDVEGSLAVLENWAPGCYDFDNGPNAAAVRTAYLAYVRWMVDYFQPTFLSHGIEIDLYDMNCPDQYASALSLMNLAYDQEKAVNPNLPIFPTVTVNNMWYSPESSACWPDDRTCLRANLSKLDSLSRDRLGLSSYPIWEFSELGEFKEDYFTAFAEETGEKIVFSETGWNNLDISIPYPTIDDECILVTQSNDEMQSKYLTYLLEAAESMDSEMVVWWSLRDYLPSHMLDSCPCDSPGLWCVLFEAMYDVGLVAAFGMWGSMGVIDYDLKEKPAWDTWEDWLVRTRKK